MTSTGSNDTPTIDDETLAVLRGYAADPAGSSVEGLLEDVEVYEDSEDDDAEPSNPLPEIGVTNPARTFFVKAGKVGGCVLLPLDEWTGVGLELEGTVLVVPAAGPPYVTTWADIRNDRRWWLRPGDIVTGSCTEGGDELSDYEYEEFIPFSFDAAAWHGTAEVDGVSDWNIGWSQNAECFDLAKVELRYATEIPNVRPGTWLEVEGAGTSMTTGEIGDTVVVGRSGEIWVHQWGYSSRLSGRIDPTDPTRAVFAAYAGGITGYSIARLTSNALTAAEFRSLYDRVTTTDANFRIEKCVVACVGFAGSAEEYVAATGGPTAGRTR